MRIEMKIRVNAFVNMNHMPAILWKWGIDVNFNGFPPHILSPSHFSLFCVGFFELRNFKEQENLSKIAFSFKRLGEITWILMEMK